MNGFALSLTAALVLIALSFMLALAPKAHAADRALTFSFDRGVINLGSTTGVKIVDPELSPPDNPAVLQSILSDAGDLSAPVSAFTFPVKRIENLETGEAALAFVDAKIEIFAANSISGHFDEGTGEANLAIPARADITVYPAGSPASVAKCRVTGFNLEMETSGTLVDPATVPPTSYEAAPFEAAPSGAGATVDTWDGLPGSTIVSGALASLVCPAVDGLVGGSGGLWLSGTATVGGEVVPTAPVTKPKLETVPPAETAAKQAEFTFGPGEGETQVVTKFQCRLDSSSEAGWVSCDSGAMNYSELTPGTHTFEVRAGNDLGYGPIESYQWTQTGSVDPPPPDPAKLGALKVRPKNKKVKRGKKVTITAKVRNIGESSASKVKICVTAPKKFIKVKKCVNRGSLAAGKTATAKFKVTVKKKAKRGKKVVLKVKATASGLAAKSGKATIRVR